MPFPVRMSLNDSLLPVLSFHHPLTTAVSDFITESYDDPDG